MAISDEDAGTRSWEYRAAIDSQRRSWAWAYHRNRIADERASITGTDAARSPTPTGVTAAPGPGPPRQVAPGSRADAMRSCAPRADRSAWRRPPRAQCRVAQGQGRG